MKITIYTTTNCQFSKQEKEYLTSHSLAYDEKNLDTNKAFLTEMMTVGNNFAGTPVTKIEKDDGTVAVLKGFTVEEFNVALGIAEAPKTEEVKPPEAMPSVAEQMAAPPVNPTPATPEPPINNVLDKLETNMNTTTPPPQTPPPATTPEPVIPTVESPASTMPSMPTTPPAGDAPAIPDFPSDAAAQPSK